MTNDSIPKTAEETELLSKLPEELQNVYEQLRERATGLGDITVGAALGARYFKFSARKMFAEIHPKPKTKELQVYVRPEGYALAEGAAGEDNGIVVTRVLDKYGWTLNHWFTVGADTDLDPVLNLITRSFDAANVPPKNESTGGAKKSAAATGSATGQNSEIEEEDGLYECGVCHELFDDAARAQDHVDTAHTPVLA